MQYFFNCSEKDFMIVVPMVHHCLLPQLEIQLPSIRVWQMENSYHLEVKKAENLGTFVYSF